MNQLKKTKQKFFNKRIFGFDIETYNDNKNFLMASIIGLNKHGDEYKKVFYNKNDLISELKHNFIFRNSYIFATNLSFDFFGTFFDTKESKNFKTLFRGSNLLSATTYYDKNEFTSVQSYKSIKNKKSRKSLTFLDSMNYAMLSVEEMGKVIGISKLNHPLFIGEYPKNKEQWDEMIKYNLRDSEITYKFMKFLINAFEMLGATFKKTIASTSMSLFKNKYLNDIYYQPDIDILKEQFNAYFGGRTEAFKRGYLLDYSAEPSPYFLYDFNSLYPSVMYDNEYPNPNTLRITHANTNRYINKYHGISHIDIEVPSSINIPILPYKCSNGRVLFPTGRFTGWYTHIEIREAIKQGAILIKVYKTHYYLENCKPFKDYVSDLYSKRLQYKSEDNPLQLICKLMLNSLYGKFGQKFLGKENTIHESCVREKELKRFSSINKVGDYLVVKEDCVPSNFCIPVWACYVTAYGRIKLHKELIEHDVVYCDTDSIITKDEIDCSSKLGDLKQEMMISEGIVVRPKFYALKDSKKHESICKECNHQTHAFLKECPKCMSDKIMYNHYVKLKGLGKRLNYYEFVGLLNIPKMSYDKFTKFKESIRRGFIPNEIIKVSKHFSLEDEKREWHSYFDYNMFEESKPINVTEMIIKEKTKQEEKRKIKENKNLMLIQKYTDNINNQLISEDFYDHMGVDITKDEYLDNEKFWSMKE